MSAFAGPSSPPGPRASLPAALRLGPVHLVVADLERSLAFYTGPLGLRPLRREDGVAALGAREDDTPVVVLHEDPAARPAGREAGLYHVALLYPTRAELARAALRLMETRTPVQGASDHGTHEAVYLADVDGNGLELAADRPRERWPPPAEEFSRGGPRPLDVPALMTTIAGESVVAEAGPGLRVGHVHLHVGDVDAGLGFYRDVLGFDVVVTLDSAAFVSAGGYHHHVAFNVWRGRDVPAAPEHVAGLEHWTVELPAGADVAAMRGRAAAAGVDVAEVAGGIALRDPWDIAVHVVVRGPA